MFKEHGQGSARWLFCTMWYQLRSFTGIHLVDRLIQKVQDGVPYMYSSEDLAQPEPFTYTWPL